MIKNEIIVPAVELHETMLCERNKYYLNFRHYTPGAGDPTSASAGFYQHLSSLDCRIVEPKRQMVFEMDKALPNAGMEELQTRLVKLCAVTPALMMCHISGKDGQDEPDILVKQRMLVQLDPDKAPLHNQRKGFLQELAFPSVSDVSGFR